MKKNHLGSKFVFVSSRTAGYMKFVSAVCWVDLHASYTGYAWRNVKRDEDVSEEVFA